MENKHDLITSIRTSSYNTESMFDDRKTAASMAVEAAAKPPETLEFNDIRKQHMDGYSQGLYEAIETNRKQFSTNFFIEVRCTRNLPQPNAFHDHFVGRKTCPKPAYDQDVYLYDRKNDELHFVWSVPDKQWSYWLLKNPDFFPDERKAILHFVHAFRDGSLYRLMKQLNNEPYDGDSHIALYKKDNSPEFIKTNKLPIKRGAHGRQPT